MLWQHRELVQNTVGTWGPELPVNSCLVMTKWWFSLTQNPNAPDVIAVTAHDTLVTQSLSPYCSAMAKVITFLLLYAHLQQWKCVDPLEELECIFMCVKLSMAFHLTQSYGMLQIHWSQNGDSASYLISCPMILSLLYCGQWLKAGELVRTEPAAAPFFLAG